MLISKITSHPTSIGDDSLNLVIAILHAVKLLLYLAAMYLIHPDSHDMQYIDQSQKGGWGGGGNYLHHLLLDPILDVHLGSSNCMEFHAKEVTSDPEEMLRTRPKYRVYNSVQLGSLTEV